MLSLFWASWALSASHVAWERRHGGFSSSSSQGSGGSPLISGRETHHPRLEVGTRGDRRRCDRVLGEGVPPWSPHCLGQPTASRVQKPGAWLPSCDQEAARTKAQKAGKYPGDLKLLPSSKSANPEESAWSPRWRQPCRRSALCEAHLSKTTRRGSFLHPLMQQVHEECFPSARCRRASRAKPTRFPLTEFIICFHHEEVTLRCLDVSGCF